MTNQSQAVASPTAPKWLPIESAPRDGKPILGWCVHGADPYYAADGRLTDYGARTEGLSHVEDGAHVVMWGEAYDVSDGWENPSCTIPAGWELSHDPEVMANPTHWMPLPQAPTDQEQMRQPDSDISESTASLRAENERLRAERNAGALEAVIRERDSWMDQAGTYSEEITDLRTQLAEAQKDAQRWQWARWNLLSMSFQSGRDLSGVTSICPIADANTAVYWDGIADNAIAALTPKEQP